MQRHKKKCIQLLKSFMLLFYLIISCTKESDQNESLVGTIDETDTGIEAMLFNPDGTPAQGASIKYFKVADTTKLPVLEVVSDEYGVFSTKGLELGNYNVYAEKGEWVAFQDSISVYADTVFIENDTLESPRTLSAIIGLQPNHDPRTVTVEVLGTDIYTNVNEDGYFTLKRMATGDFTLKLSTTLDDYTTTFKNITIKEDTPDNISDTLWLIYTGIPVVIGLDVDYDTIAGLVKLSWEKTKYGDLQDYLIYRDFYDSINLSLTPISLANDTFFYDTIFDMKKNSGEFSYNDTNSYHFKYRVKVRNNSQEIGLSYKFVDIFTPSPQNVITITECETFHIDKGVSTEISSVNDSILYIINIKNRKREIRKISYKDLSKNLIMDEIEIDSVKEFKDSLIIIWNEKGINELEISVTDETGFVKKDTISFTVVPDLPKVNIQTTHINLNDTATIKAKFEDGFGEVTKIEWKVGYEGVFEEGNLVSSEKKIFIQDTMLTSITIIVKVQDDDGNISIDTADISIGINWKKVKLPNNLGQLYDAIVLNDVFYVFTLFNEYIWRSFDGKDWEKVGDFSSLIGTHSFSDVAVLKNRMYLLGISSNNNHKNKVLSSEDGITWDSVETDFDFKDYPDKIFFSSFKETLYAGKVDSTISEIGGSLFSSKDGIVWDTITIDGGNGVLPPPCNYEFSISEVDDILYIATTTIDKDSILLYKTVDWENVEHVTNFNSAGNWSIYYFRINNYMDKLCTYTIEDYNNKSISMKYTNDLITWHEFSKLDVDYKFQFVKCIVFKGKNYILGSSEMWTSN